MVKHYSQLVCNKLEEFILQSNVLFQFTRSLRDVGTTISAAS